MPKNTVETYIQLYETRTQILHRALARSDALTLYFERHNLYPSPLPKEPIQTYTAGDWVIWGIDEHLWRIGEEGDAMTFMEIALCVDMGAYTVFTAIELHPITGIRKTMDAGFAIITDNSTSPGRGITIRQFVERIIDITTPWMQQEAIKTELQKHIHRAHNEYNRLYGVNVKEAHRWDIIDRILKNKRTIYMNK